MRRKYFFSVCSYYCDPISKDIVKNPNYEKHALELIEKRSSDPRELLEICKSLLEIDGTTVFVINGENGNQIVENCKTGELFEYNGEDACGQ